MFNIIQEAQTSRPHLRKFNIIRGLALTSEMISDLEDKGIHMRPRHSSDVNHNELLVLHPVDFSDLFTRIRSNLHLIECELFNMSLNKFGEFPSSKTGITIISSLSETSKRLEEFILTMNSIPLEIASLREVTMILYEQGFALHFDNVFTSINRDLNTIFEVYQVFEKLHISGSANLSTCAQLSFLATTVSELTKYWPEFSSFSDYFKHLNVFDIDFGDLFGHISEFRKVSTSDLMKWTCADIISRFTQQYKSTYTAATIVLRNEPLESLPSKLLSQLTGWLNQIRHMSMKQSTLREMNIRMHILRDMLSDYLEKHSSTCQSTAQFEQLFVTIDLIGQFNDLFSAKSIIKDVLTFTERIDTGDGSTPVVDDTVSEQEQPSAPFVSQSNSFIANISQSVRSPSQASFDGQHEESEIDLNSVTFTDEERQLWSNFCRMVFSKETVPVHQQFPAYSVEFIHQRAQVTFDEFKEEWCTNTNHTFDHELEDIYNAISKPSYDDETLIFPVFDEKVYLSLEQEFDILLTQLLEFNPPSRGRGYPREFPPHPKASQIGELHKNVQSIKEHIRTPDFSWLPDFLECRRVANILFKATDLTNDGHSPLVTLRKLTNKSFTYFRLIRLLRFAKGTLPLFDPDIKLMKSLISILAEKIRFVQENSPLLLHEIDQVIKSQTVCNFSNLSTTVRVLSRSRNIFDPKELVHMADLEFFDFDDYFKKLPPHVTTLSSFLNSTVFDVFCRHSCQTIRHYVESGFDPNFIIDQFHLRLQFKQDFCHTPIPINWERTDESCSTLFSLQELIDISTAFDRVHPLVKFAITSSTDSDNMSHLIQGTDYLSIELLIFALQRDIESLVQANPSDLCRLFLDLTKVLTAMKNVPTKFGPRKLTNKYIISFRDTWVNFIESMHSLPMSDFNSHFRLLSNKIIDVIQEDDHDPNIQSAMKTISYLVKQYEVFPDKQTLQKLQFSFKFISMQLNHTNQNVASDLPFFQLNVTISAMLSIYSICELIPLITSRIEHTMHCTIPHHVPSISDSLEQTIPTIPNESLTKSETDLFSHSDNETKVTLSHELSLFDQTSVCHMSSSLFDANLAAQEKIISIPLIHRHVSRTHILIANSEASNREFAMINECLQNCILSHHKIPHTDKTPKTETKIKESNIHPLQVTEEEIVKKYNREQNTRHIEHRLVNAETQYNRTLSRVSTFADTKCELETSIQHMEQRQARNVIIEQLNEFESHLDELSTIDDTIYEKTQKIIKMK